MVQVMNNEGASISLDDVPTNGFENKGSSTILEKPQQTAEEAREKELEGPNAEVVNGTKHALDEARETLNNSQQIVEDALDKAKEEGTTSTDEDGNVIEKAAGAVKEVTKNSFDWITDLLETEKSPVGEKKPVKTCLVESL